MQTPVVCPEFHDRGTGMPHRLYTAQSLQMLYKARTFPKIVSIRIQLDGDAMDFGDELCRKLRLLEESLWKSETRFNVRYLETILSNDFFEFGRSGKVYTRDETIAAPKQEIGAALPLREFKCHYVSEDVALVTYVTEVSGSGGVLLGNRSSIWVKTPDGWKLRFHQGTPRKE